MKVNLSLLIILLMVGTCWCSDCRMANWWTSFDHAGWSQCGTKEYVTGFYRNHKTPSDPISLLEEARCCKAPGQYRDTFATCEYANWWSRLDGTSRWAFCSHGYFIQDLYRSSGNGISNIEQAYCCKPNTLRDRYGHCYNQNVWISFDGKGLSRCKDGYYLVGIYKGSCNHLYCIEQFKCCQMDV